MKLAGHHALVTGGGTGLPESRSITGQAIAVAGGEVT